MVGNDGVETQADGEVSSEVACARAREEAASTPLRPEWRPPKARREGPAGGRDAGPSPLPPLDLPELPEDAAECALKARRVAWVILHEAEKAADRMSAARFFVDLAKEAGKSPGEADPDPLGTLARAQGGER